MTDPTRARDACAPVSAVAWRKCRKSRGRRAGAGRRALGLDSCLEPVLELEPNGRRAARLVTAFGTSVTAMRPMNASGWMEAVPHPPRADGRPRGAARLAIRASITIVAWRARSCSQATRRRPKPSRRRPASDAPAWAPRPHPRCKTGRGCDTGPQRRKDDNPTAGHKQLCGACGLSRRAPRARSQRSRPSSSNDLEPRRQQSG